MRSSGVELHAVPSLNTKLEHMHRYHYDYDATLVQHQYIAGVPEVSYWAAHISRRRCCKEGRLRNH
jgi:hypothetical protein